MKGMTPLTERPEKCMAEVPEPPHYSHAHRCNRAAKGTRAMRPRVKGDAVPQTVDAPVCGTHLRMKYPPRLFEGER